MSQPDLGADEPSVGPGAELRSRALKLLTTREHSRQELTRKLRARGYPEDDVAQALDDLVRDGLLNEERMLAAYVAERLEKGFGPVRIRFELREKGLADAQIAPHLALDDATLMDLITAVSAKRFGNAGTDTGDGDSGQAPAHDRQSLAKRARFLEYRGFPAHLIARYLDTV